MTDTIQEWPRRLGKQAMAEMQKKIDRLERELDRARRLLGAVVADKICPECGDGRGYTAEQCTPDGDWEQVQCQWCDEVRRALEETAAPSDAEQGGEG